MQPREYRFVIDTDKLTGHWTATEGDYCARVPHELVEDFDERWLAALNAVLLVARPDIRISFRIVDRLDA